MFSRSARRLGVSLIVLGLIVWLASLVVLPFYHPRATVVFLAPPFESMARGSQPFVPTQQTAWQAISPQLEGRGDHRVLVAELAPPRPLAGDLEALLSRRLSTSTGVVVVFVSAPVVVWKGEPCFVTRYENRESPPSPYLEVSSLLEQLTQFQARTKLLVLDMGDIEQAPQPDLQFGDAPARIERIVRNSGDPALWVMMSQQALERSHVSHVLGQSVFGYFAARGLRGYADRGDIDAGEPPGEAHSDGLIDLAEFERYVNGHVRAWVDQMTAGQASQSPHLCWGGGSLADVKRWPMLMAAARQLPASTGDDLTRAVTEALHDRSAVSMSAFSSPLSAADDLARQGVTAAQAPLMAARNLLRNPAALASEVSRSASAPPAAAATNTVGPAASPTTAVAAAHGNNSAPNGAGSAKATEAPAEAGRGEAISEKAALAGGAAPVADAKAGTASPTAVGGPTAPASRPVSRQAVRQLTEAWMLHDELAERRRLGLSPADFSPQLWREFQRQLRACEYALQFAREEQALAISGYLERELLPLATMYNADSFPTPEPETLAERIDAARPRWPSVSPGGNIALDEALHVLTGRSLSPQTAAARKALDDVRAAATRTDAEKSLRGLSPEETDNYRELQLARRLIGAPQVDWNQARDILQLRALAEQVAATAFAPSPWLRERLRQADEMADRIEYQAFARIHADWSDRITNAIRETRPVLEDLKQDAQDLETIARQRVDLVSQVPDFGILLRLVGQDGAREPWDPAIWNAWIEELNAVGEMLDSPQAELLPDLVERSRRLRQLTDTLNGIWSGRRVEQWLGQRPAAIELWRGQAVLATALPPAAVRLALLSTQMEREGQVVSQFLPVNDWELRDTPIHTRPKEAGIPRTEFWNEMAAKLTWPPPSVAENPASMFRLQAERIEHSRAGVNGEQHAAFARWERFYRTASAPWDAAALNAGGIPPGVVMTTPDQVDLLVSPTALLEVELSNPRSRPFPVWLALDFDDSQIAAQPLEDGAWPSFRELVAVARNSRQIGKPENVPPAAVLAPGERRTLRIRLRREGLAGDTPRLAVLLVSPGHAEHRIVEIVTPRQPTCRLRFAAVPGSWYEDSAGVTLQPFANRVTEYQILLANLLDREQVVDVQVFAANKDARVTVTGTQPAATASDLLRELTDGKPLVEATGLKLPVTGEEVTVRWPPPKPAAPVAPAAPGASATPTASDAPAAADAGAAKTPLSTPAPHGLVVAVAERATGQVWMQPIPIMPQRPRRFLSGNAGYDRTSQRLTLSVWSSYPDRLPLEPVQLRATLRPGLAPGAQARLAAPLTRSIPRAELYAEIPPRAGESVRVELAVDNYPRALVFDVPCDGTITELAPRSDLLELELTGLAAGQVLAAPVAAVPVELRVDVPTSTAFGPQDALYVGLDQNGDRELYGDAILSLRSDRQTTVAIEAPKEDGTLPITVNVTDFQLALPASGLENVRVNVLAHLVFADRDVWSSPIPISLDASAPGVRSPRLTPSRSVTAGTDVTLSLLARESGAATVAKVEAAIDVQGIGTFPAAPPPVPGVANRDGRWEIKLATKDLLPGSYTILVRTTDSVGNQSGPLPIPGLTILPTNPDGNLNTVSGTVAFGQRPVSGADVELKGDPKVVLPLVKSDAQGRFSIAKVPPGKYKLTARGLVRNKPSQAESDVEVKLPPAPVPDLELQLR